MFSCLSQLLGQWRVYEVRLLCSSPNTLFKLLLLSDWHFWHLYKIEVLILIPLFVLLLLMLQVLRLSLVEQIFNIWLISQGWGVSNHAWDLRKKCLAATAHFCIALRKLLNDNDFPACPQVEHTLACHLENQANKPVGNKWDNIISWCSY